MNYLGERDFDHCRGDLDAVVLVNLGTPEAPTTASVRRYLGEFLSDPRIIEIPRLLWWLILHGVILRIRPRRSARAYREIWRDDGSPLLVLTRQLTEALAAELDPDRGRPLEVVFAMRYGEPSVGRVLDGLRARNLRRLLIVPLYPQYSATTTASVFDAVVDAIKRWRRVPELRFVADYWTSADYIEALATSIRNHVGEHGQPDRLLFSFHGIPKRYLMAGDPYFCQCQGTAARVAALAGLAPDRFAVSFQSRVGREPWLKPYTDVTLAEWPKAGIKRVAVICPGFAVDCLETLEEIAVENRDAFLEAGGERLDYIPALNAAPAHVSALAALVRRHAHGWPAFDGDFDAAATRAQLDARRARAEAVARDAPP